MRQTKNGPGRPPKYGRAARAVTITLPEDVLTRLAAVDADLGRAIVRMTERGRRRRMPAIRPAEVSSYGNNSVIVVFPAKVLNRLPGVQLVPIGDGRALISLEHQTPVSQLELDVHDALERPNMQKVERLTLEAINAILRQARRSPEIAVTQRTILVLEKKRTRRRR